MSEENLHKDGQGFVTGALIGALAGSVAAMLLTPKSGKEMRQTLLEYIQEWEDGNGELGEDAKQLLATFKKTLGEGAEVVRTQAPRVASQAGELAGHAVEKVEDGYVASRDTVSEMVEAFRSQWQELEENEEEVVFEEPLAAEPTTAHGRYRGAHRSWNEDVAEQKANEVYVEELQEEAQEPVLTPRRARPTLAEYRQSAEEAKTVTKRRVPAAKVDELITTPKPRRASGPRKMLFRSKE